MSQNFKTNSMTVYASCCEHRAAKMMRVVRERIRTTIFVGDWVKFGLRRAALGLWYIDVLYPHEMGEGNKREIRGFINGVAETLCME